MKLFNLLIIILIIISSCKKNEEIPVIAEESYGEGMYIVTSTGVSFYNYKDSLPQVINQIYQLVNNTAINNPKKIKFRGSDAYIIADNYILIVNVKSFENKGSITGFDNPVDLDFADPNDRLFVLDIDNSKVKVVDLLSLEIISDIETGFSTRPDFILSNFNKSFVLNGGGSSIEQKDSTIVVIEFRDNLVPIANFEGSLLVGDNPNSAFITSSGRLKVLCKGIYDSINTINNTFSAVSDINQFTNEVYSTDNLLGIYNARNLTSNWDNSSCYFTAQGGVYRLNINSLNTNLLTNVNASVINTVIESFPINDTTNISYEMLYMNDINYPNSIYKYNIDLSEFVDTFIVDGSIRDIRFY
jgi:hypothetical protein